MHHLRPIVGTMPMCHTRRTPDDVARCNPFWFLPLVANPAFTFNDSQKLAPLMPVPLRAGTWLESDHSYRSVVVTLDLGGRLMPMQRIDGDRASKEVEAAWIWLRYHLWIGSLSSAGYDRAGRHVVDICCRLDVATLLKGRAGSQGPRSEVVL